MLNKDINNLGKTKKFNKFLITGLIIETYTVSLWRCKNIYSIKNTGLNKSVLNVCKLYITNGGKKNETYKNYCKKL